MKDKPGRWRELTAEQQAKVEQYIDLLLAEQPPLIPENDRREVLEVRQAGNVWYTLEKICCGKSACRCARDGEKHGPYWYARWRSGGKQKCKYIGKNFRELANSY